MGGEWGGTQLSGHQSSGIGLAVKHCIDMLKKLLKKDTIGSGSTAEHYGRFEVHWSFLPARDLSPA